MEFKYEVDENYEKEKEIDGDLDVDTDTVYVKHIEKAQTNLCNRIIEILNEKDLSSYEVEKIFNEKRIELFTILSPMIDEWITKIKVDYGHK